MGLFRYLRRRRERERAISAEQLAALDQSGTQAIESDEQKAIGDSVLKAMREHGIDPASPDPTRLMDPEVQRALRDALLKHAAGGDG